MDIGKAKVSALELIGEFFMVESKKMKDGGLQVVDVYLSIDYFTR